jgi:hypothetical protein
MDVFKQPPGLGAVQLKGVPSMYTQDFQRGNRAAGYKLIFSSTLFIFPGRAEGPYGTDYKVMVGRYLAGLRSSIQNMKYFPMWGYRVHIDLSVCLPYEKGSEIYDIAGMVKKEVCALATEFPELQVVGCQYALPGLEHGATFLPSVWRFLPTCDPTVDVFVSWDADLPAHPLLVHYIEDWVRTDTGDLLFMPLERHVTDQCTIYVASHMRTEDARMKMHTVCPYAQMWAARRTPGSVLFQPSIMAEMLAMTSGTAMHDFMSGTADGELRQLAKKVMATSAYPDAARNHVHMRVEDAIAPLSEIVQQKAHEEFHLTGAPWARAIAEDVGVADFATLIMFSKPLIERLPAGAVKRLISRSTSAKHVEAMRRIVTKSDYGIDEWVMHVLMKRVLSPSTVSYVNASTPQAGIYSERFINRNPRPALPLYADLEELVPLLKFVKGWTDGDRVINQFKVFAVRTGTLLRMVMPGANADESVYAIYKQLVEAYSTRLKLSVGATTVLDKKKASALVQSFLLAFLKDDRYLVVARDIIVLRGDARRFTAYIDKGTGQRSTVDFNTWRFSCGSAKAMSVTIEVLVRVMFLRLFDIYQHMSPDSIPIPWVPPFK